MKNAENKTNLNALVAVHAMRPQTWGWDNEVVVTDNTTIRSSRVGVKDIFTWIPSAHEEADNRMVIHIIDMISNGITNITLRSNDTDVIIILLSFMLQFIEQNNMVVIRRYGWTLEVATQEE